MTRRSISKQCKLLKLGRIPHVYQEIPYKNKEQYLTELLQLEIEGRQANRVKNLIKRAGFPVHKLLEDFDWLPVTLPESTSISDLTDLSFLEEKENVLSLGAVGTGKTHLAIALGLRACMEGKRVCFYQCLDLVNELLENHRQDNLAKLLERLKKAHLIIIDELGFVPLHQNGAELLFNVVAQAYERQSLIVTSNLQFGQWNSVLGDDRLTAALIDRLVHHAHILAFDGPSYRLKQALSTIPDCSKSPFGKIGEGEQ